MKQLDATPVVISWLTSFLALGGTLSQAMLRRLGEPIRISGVVPQDWNPQHPSELDLGGRRLSRAHVLEEVRTQIRDHFASRSTACAVVEDLWAEKEYPCGADNLPWMIVNNHGHDDLYWVADSRQSRPNPDSVLGAVTGRRYLAVLSAWTNGWPPMCQVAPTTLIDQVAKSASAVVVELFDGESYVVIEFLAT